MDVGLVGLIFVVLEKKTLAVSSTKRGGRGGGVGGGGWAGFASDVR